jgi:hypothetical protein
LVTLATKDGCGGLRIRIPLAIIFILALAVTVYGHFSSIATAVALIPLEISFMLDPATPSTTPECGLFPSLSIVYGYAL